MAGYNLRPRRKAGDGDQDATVLQAKGLAQVHPLAKGAATAAGVVDSEHGNNGDNKCETNHALAEITTSSISPPAKKKTLASSNKTTRKTPSKKKTPRQPLPRAYTPHCDNCLSIPEMRELILLKLDEHSILTCMRISRSFEATVRSSIKLQRRLFLAPNNSISPIFINPMVFHATRPTDLMSLALLKSDPNKHFHLKRKIEVNIERGNSRLGSAAEMFVTQPPVNKIRVEVSYWDTNFLEPMLSGGSSGTLELPDGEGIKMKDLVVFAKSKLAEGAEFLRRKPIFGVMGPWTGPEFRLRVETKDGQLVMKR
ncbi:unnamed protein product [Zymoseptoria tritici ST99CH_3D7]|uniref:F-box domain-containing protein n=1 Tax=Zymoseptoria tritici (strain ST99CH_3D7) TaxID=1276538 RepID=A0A1X7RZI0_ZYMT9|nr:unnamed protein product [Zymoseptoria tritici ST99CH_3D7]